MAQDRVYQLGRCVPIDAQVFGQEARVNFRLHPEELERDDEYRRQNNLSPGVCLA